jgi:DNA-binding NtrC family response regulator
MRDVYELTRRIANNRCPVLIVGERGTGRETVARSIHQHGPLRDAPFRRVPAAIARPAELEEILTSAEGILYIEGLTDLVPGAQAWLEDWLGNDPRRTRTASAPVRFICAARPRIDALVSSGTFTRSLYDAVSIVRIDLPALRERPQDIPLLAKHFLKETCVRHAVASKTLSRSSLALLSALPWRGNAAELRGLIERLVVLVPRGVILQEDVLQHLRFDDVQARGASGGTLREARAQFEREFIASTLQRHQWRMEEAAEELGIERTNLYRKMKQLSIIRGDPRS